MLVYTHTITPRVRYIFNVLLKEMMGIDFQYTQDADMFKASALPKLAYAHERFSDGLYIQAHQLLFETGIKKLSLEVFSYRDLPAFFQGEGQLPFDIFAASFYLVSRYEEYLPSRKDKFGRYQAKHSLAYKHGFLDKPVINLWLEELKKLIKESYPSVQIKDKHFNATITYDIDVAYAFKGRSFVRNILGAGKELLSLKLPDFLHRLTVHTARVHDPYDSYDYILRSLETAGVKHIFFFLLAKKLSKYDRNISTSSREMALLVKQISAASETGIHPSYYSSDEEKMLIEEKRLLETLLGHPVTISRQHYLRFQLPGTFMQLIEAGILHEYSMGYAELPGFRAGICSPFPFYNLSEEQETTLVIHPVTYMEGSFIEDMQMQPAEAIYVIERLLKAVKSVNGEFICIWHNHTLSDYKLYKGWRKPYETTLRLLKETE